jgi:hypothetical protein
VRLLIPIAIVLCAAALAQSAPGKAIAPRPKEVKSLVDPVAVTRRNSGQTF